MFGLSKSASFKQRCFGLAGFDLGLLKHRMDDLDQHLQLLDSMMDAMSVRTTAFEFIDLRLQKTSRTGSGGLRSWFLRWKQTQDNVWCGDDEFEELLQKCPQHLREWLISNDQEREGLNKLYSIMLYERRVIGKLCDKNLKRKSYDN